MRTGVKAKSRVFRVRTAALSVNAAPAMSAAARPSVSPPTGPRRASDRRGASSIRRRGPLPYSARGPAVRMASETPAAYWAKFVSNMRASSAARRS